MNILAIDPKSTAGILLREHDTISQALAYAERKASALLAMRSTLGLDYAQAAAYLREEQARQRREFAANHECETFMGGMTG
jgi:hypothetical protein